MRRDLLSLASDPSRGNPAILDDCSSYALIWKMNGFLETIAILDMQRDLQFPLKATLTQKPVPCLKRWLPYSIRRIFRIVQAPPQVGFDVVTASDYSWPELLMWYQTLYPATAIVFHQAQLARVRLQSSTSPLSTLLTSLMQRCQDIPRQPRLLQSMLVVLETVVL